MRIYIESTIPSYVVARPARDLLQAARQQMTRDWWDLRSSHHELFASQIVLDEIVSGEVAMAHKRLDLMANIPLLDLTDEARSLTQGPPRFRAVARQTQTAMLRILLLPPFTKWIYFELELSAHRQCSHSAWLRRLWNSRVWHFPCFARRRKLLENCMSKAQSVEALSQHRFGVARNLEHQRQALSFLRTRR